MDQPITLVLDPKTLDYIANVLGTRPYAEVAQVLQTIATQVQGQRAGPNPVLQASNGSGDAQTLPAH